ncbi:MAG: NusG domain II-containing protein [Oscillospiraceae bacterium]|nr:NusG domain II-containing protein [Oscillospiraceae bacterium]
MKLITLRDLAIILSILIISVIFLAINFRDNGTYAEISYDGKVVKTVSLSEDSEFSVNDIKFSVKENSVCVVSSPCPDKICVKTGAIKRNGETIICLPEKVSVRIISDDKVSADIIVG